MILRARGLVKSYHGVDAAPTRVLRGVDVSVDNGVIISIMGPSGAGKSTLLHVLGSLDRADTGTVELCHNDRWIDLQTATPAVLSEVRAHAIGIVYQFHHLLPEFTAVENVMMPARIVGVSKSESRSRALKLLERVHLSHRADHLPSELSGGEQQRVAVARALMNQPRIVLADEPTGNLDTENAEQVSDLLIEMVRERGSSCIIATHSAELASRADLRYIMIDGVLTQC
ncbi:MAG: ABC transporter ATP-binding protein [Candidatus Kapabacteria bacterium]|nr:ABC transporter ATP-binding protein [Candidatus Kapabacteria bacterium]